MGNPYIAEDIAMMKHFDDKEAQIRKSERERIIALLEAECCDLEDCRCEARIKWAIALIKGEN